MPGRPPQIKTRFLLLSDTHNAALPPASTPHPFRHPLPQADVLIHAGDLTTTGTPHEHDTTFALVAGAPAPLKLVIAGNHDLSLDAAYVAQHSTPALAAAHAYARTLWTSPAARAAGIHFLDEGAHALALPNGARLAVYASPYTPEFYDWAFMYPRATDLFNAPRARAPVPAGVDVVVTHGPPARHLGGTATGVDAGCAHLLAALQRVRPRLHVFGHIHEAWGARRVAWREARDGRDEARDVPVDGERVARDGAAFADASAGGAMAVERGKESLLVNASIMDLRYRPRQAPWVVDLDLDAWEEGDGEGDGEGVGRL